MNLHHTYLLEQFIQASKYGEAVGQRPEHEGTPRTYFGLRNGVRRQVIQGWIDDHQDIAYDDWVALIDALYHGQSYEERCTPPTLLAKFPEYRQQLPLTQLDLWLGQLEGWAEIDSTCQSIFKASELLTRWDNWQPLLQRLTQDDNINKRRASIVLLTTPISDSSDKRFLKQALYNVEALQHEQDKLITKAISWVLRKGIKQHRHAIISYLDDYVESLPAVAVRETRRKLETGKK